MLYRHVLIMLLSTLLIACDDQSAFMDPAVANSTTTTSGGGGGGGGGDGGDGGDDGGGGGGGATTDFSNITLMSHIPLRVPDGFGGTLTTIPQTFDMGNSDNSISYILQTSDNAYRVFRPTPNGHVEIYTRPAPELIFITTAGDGNELLSWNGRRDIIDYANGNLLSIGTALGATPIRNIADAGDLVAFSSRDDLTGNNPLGVNQIFTLATDGSEAYNQITTFTIDYIIVNVIISGDGSRVFFRSTDDIIPGDNADGSREVFSINTNGSGLAQLTNLDSLIVITHTSADGTVITMDIIDLNGVTGRYLYTLNTTTSALTEITVDPQNGLSIDHDLSSDGSKITYRGVDASNTPVIYLVNSDGTSEISALTHSGTMQYLHINTDGTQITFQSNIDFGKTIGVDEHSTQIYTLVP